MNGCFFLLFINNAQTLLWAVLATLLDTPVQLLINADIYSANRMTSHDHLGM